ncbi:hypothetical protein SAMN05660742_11714 [Propionispira arboris]|uniref:Uncharacterized protein n=1 Tax=Propionispira arboris TaxID=84035 RepID=A0A1H7BN47_9FIRM|nr:hypothetical protein SAMN05660742_11714 [Propionispira arboris]
MDSSSLAHTKWKCQYHSIYTEVQTESFVRENKGGCTRNINKALQI